MTLTHAFEAPVPFTLRAKMLPASVGLERRVQFAVLLQIAKSGRAYWATTAAICAGADQRDVETALLRLVDDGSIAGPICRLDSLVTLAERGLFELTARGRARLDEDDV